MVNFPRKTLIPFGTPDNLPVTKDLFFEIDNTPGNCSIQFNLTVPAGGKVDFTGTFDGINYMAMSLRSTGTMRSYMTSTSQSGNYLGSIAGYRTLRFVVSAPATKTGTIMGTMSYNPSTLEGLEHSAPSNFESELIRGTIVGNSIINRYGRNPKASAGSGLQDLWDGGGLYTGFPATAEPVVVQSTSILDAALGTGARTVQVDGLDINYNAISEVVTLNGLLVSNPTTQSFLRVLMVAVKSVGIGESNAGIISCMHFTTRTNVFCRMQPGYNRSLISSYTVPAGYTGFMRKLGGNVRGGNAAIMDGFIWTRPFGSVWVARRPFTFSAGAPLSESIYGGLIFREKADLVLRLTGATVKDADAVMFFDMVVSAN